MYIGVKSLDELDLLMTGDLCPLSITVALTISCQKQLSSNFIGLFSYCEDSLTLGISVCLQTL